MTETTDNALTALTPDNVEIEKKSLEGRTAQAMDRYRDGYLHARTIIGLGEVIKTIAWLASCVLAFAGMVFWSSTDNSFGEIGGILIILVGLILGGFGYILGVLVQSAGQSMKAHFDCAINGSHFLNDDQRAEVMSLT